MFIQLGKHIIEVSLYAPIATRYSLHLNSKKSVLGHSGILISGSEIKIYKDFMSLITVSCV